MCVCLGAQGTRGKPRSQELKHPKGTGLSSDESRACLAPTELLSIFHGWSPNVSQETCILLHFGCACQKTVYWSHVVVLPPQGRTADTFLSHDNSYPFKSSWLEDINPHFFHACGQVHRCFQHPGWNHKQWDKFEPPESCVRLDVREELPSPRHYLHCCPNTSNWATHPQFGGGCLNHEGHPPLPCTHSWPLGCLLGCLWLDREREKKKDLSFGFEIKLKVIFNKDDTCK